MRILETVSSLLRFATPSLTGIPPELLNQLRHEARHCPLQVRCLEFAVSCWFLLKCLHLRPELVVGVRLLDARLTSHAWVELDGVPVDSGDNAARVLYTSLQRYR